MDKEKSQAFFKRFPLLYRDAGLGPERTGLYWGIQAGSGRMELIERASVSLEAELERMRAAGTPLEHLPKATQVKEKLGSLRIQISPWTENLYAIADQAGQESQEICQHCGQSLSRPHCLGSIPKT